MHLPCHLETLKKQGKMAALGTAAWMSDKFYEDVYVRLSVPAVE